MSWFGQDKMERAVNTMVEKAFMRLLRTAESDVLNAVQLSAECEGLKRQVCDLKIEKDREKEASVRNDREIEHKLGLHKAQVEWEVEEAGARAKLEVEQTNLQTEREAFSKEMAFMQGRFEEEVKYQRDLLEQMMERLPTAKILAKIKGD